jgi:DNA sulfur modification protein DndD
VWIRSIELENYRQYRGHHSIELSIDPKRSFTIIQGPNGAGKTNLLNAVTWCLYGVEDHLSKYTTKNQPKVNEGALHDAKTGETIKTSVTINILDSQDHLYVLEREKYAKQLAHGTHQIGQGEVAHAYMQDEGDMISISDFDMVVNRFLPQGIRSFFLFDGERLDDFFKEEKSARVRDAIFDVSQLSLLDNARRHLEDVIGDLRRQDRGFGDESDKIQDQIDQIEAGIDDYNNEVSSTKDELEAIRIQEGKIQEQLMDCNEALVKELEQERSHSRDELERIDKDLEDGQKQAFENIVRQGPAILSLRAIDESLDLIAAQTKKGELPPKIQEVFVSELLDRGVCICGNDISQQTTARAKVSQLLKNVSLSEIAGDLTELKFELGNLRKETQSFLPEQDKLRKRIVSREREKEGLKQRVQELNTRLVGIDVENVSNLSFTREQLEKDERAKVAHIAKLEQRITDAKAHIQALSREKDRQVMKSEKNRVVVARRTLAQSALTLFETIWKKLIDETRSKIQSKTQEYFLSLIWKKQTYQSVTIDSEYNIAVINKWGSDCLGTLSAGERQVLALSFLAALREVSGFEAPIIIDTPLGRISKEPRENIARLLPKFLGETQATMFVTDQEYTPAVRQLLSGRVGKEYRLEYDEKLSQTEVMPFGE